MTTFKGCLEESDMEALKSLDLLKKDFICAKLHDEWKEMEILLERYDFEGTLKVLERICETHNVSLENVTHSS